MESILAALGILFVVCLISCSLCSLRARMALSKMTFTRAPAPAPAQAPAPAPENPGPSS